MQFNRDGPFRISVDSLCGTAMHAIGEVLHDVHNHFWSLQLSKRVVSLYGKSQQHVSGHLPQNAVAGIDE